VSCLFETLSTSNLVNCEEDEASDRPPRDGKKGLDPVPLFVVSVFFKILENRDILLVFLEGNEEEEEDDEKEDELDGPSTLYSSSSYKAMIFVILKIIIMIMLITII
jgi:hypothetical protein